MLRERTLRNKNIIKINGKYRFVNHEDGLATKGFENLEDLAFGAYGIPFDAVAIVTMRGKYRAFYGETAPLDRQDQNHKAMERPRKGGKGKKPTRRDLELAYWGPLHDQVAEYNVRHNCDVKPWDCVKHAITKFKDHPKFLGYIRDYSMAVAILWNEETKEHEPVFFGDKIYSKKGDVFDWSDPDYLAQINTSVDCWTWVPPRTKREFDLNGEKLPCPEKENGNEHWLEFSGAKFYFRSKGDRDQVHDAIGAILLHARDK